MEGAPLSRQRARIPIELRIVLVALGFRAIGAIVGFIANVTIPDYQDQGFTVFQGPNPFWDRFARYDSGWYYGIASGGYAFVEGGRSNLAFFPLYPTLMGVGGRLLGGEQQDFYFAGIVISWLSFALAMPLLYRLALLDLPSDSAIRATTFAAVFPSAYFFGVVYSEALFLLTLVGAVLALRTRHWRWAAIAGAVDDRDARQRRDVRAGAGAGLPGNRRRRRSAGSRVRRWPPRPAARSASARTACSTTSSAAIRSSGTTASRGGATTPAAIRLSGLFAIGHALRDAAHAVPLHRTDGAVRHASTQSSPCRAVPVPLGVEALRLRLRADHRARPAAAAVVRAIRGSRPLLRGAVPAFRSGWARCRGKPDSSWLIACFVLFYTLGLVLFGNVHPLF